MSETREVEIHGVKINIPTQTKPFEVRVGDKVKVLVREYSGAYRIDVGIVMGFCQFKKLPSIVVAHLKSGYSPEICFSTLNSQTEDKEICPAFEDEVLIDKQEVITALEQQVCKKQIELEEIKTKKDYILSKFDIWIGTKQQVYENAIALAANVGVRQQDLEAF